jgi:predicted RNA methylase
MNTVVHTDTTQQAVSSVPNGERRKRLGQYFTGARLARLLAVLADAQHSHDVVDPMCGTGDMLIAVRELCSGASLSGVEIDRAAAALCADRFRERFPKRAHLLVGNAFAWETIRQLPRLDCDLVITNPPYVRYQSLAGSRTDHPDLPDAEAVRRGVCDTIDHLTHLGDEERRILRALTNAYSGLSDLAVPSWLLCVALTRVGGRLAMVVPEAWLSRQYAHPIQYLLLKLFRVRFVVEDAHRTWFDEALIKTTLVVAERVPTVEDLAASLADQEYMHVALPGSASDERSVVGQLFPDSAQPELEFARALTDASSPLHTREYPGLSIRRRALAGTLDQIVTAATRSRWFSLLEPGLRRSLYVTSNGTRNASANLPQELLIAVPEAAHLPLTTLAELGVSVGQGLRTGANGFFYVDLVNEQNGIAIVAPSKPLQLDSIEVPAAALQPVLRRQSEASAGFRLDSAKLRGRVLVLEAFIHPGDAMSDECFAQETLWGSSERRVMPPGLASLVDAAAMTNVGTADTPRLIPELSAVRTNNSSGSPRTGMLPRCWYMLPNFARRHLPDLFVARVNNRHPKVMLNPHPKTVIDANFSTIWREDEAKVTAAALLAMLNSSWSIAMMEALGAVLGGGALKLEAAHLRRMPLPQLSSEIWRDLDQLGCRLGTETDTAPIRAQIDLLVGSAVFGPERAEDVLQRIRQTAETKLSARAARV